MSRNWQPALPLLTLALGLLACGCITHHPLALNSRDFGPDPIYTQVRDKLKEQTRTRTGDQRWQRFRGDEYQSTTDIRRDRRGLEDERQRWQQARAVCAAGTLTLEACLAFALEFNDRIQAKRAAIRGAKAEELIAHSRFLPQLTYALSLSDEKPSGAASWDRERDQSVGVQQSLFEFGKHAAEDVAARTAQRDALFAYEEQARSILSQVRIRFFTILLRQKQLTERQRLLQEFQTRHKRIAQLVDASRAPEVDVLTARLNVLNEEAHINSLEQEILRQKIDLLHLSGFPVGMSNCVLQGKPPAYAMDLKSSIDIGLRRSTVVAESRAKAAEQYRVAHQTLWAFAPDISLEAGRETADGRGGMRVDGTDGQYGVSVFGEKRIHSGPDPADEPETRRYAEVLLELPIFDGLERYGRYRKERARLNELQHELRDTIDEVEARIRKAYQTMLERRKELAIARERVKISKERLRIKERLKELGRITDNELETFRNQFFNDQDAAFGKEIDVVNAQEELRFAMRYFEPEPPAAEEPAR